MSALGQNTSRLGSPISADLNGSEQCIDRLKAAEAKNAAYERIIADADARIALLERLATELTASRDAYKTEAATRAQVNTGDTADRILAAKVEALMREQYGIMKDDRDRLLAENNRLRHPGVWKTLFDPRTLAAGFAGYEIGRVGR